MALQAYNDWRVAVCCWHSPFFRQPLHAEYERCEVDRRDYTFWRISLYGWLGMLGMGILESVSKLAYICLYIQITREDVYSPNRTQSGTFHIS